MLGAVVIVALPELFRELQAYRLLVFGLMLMVLMIFRPQGILVPRAVTTPSTPSTPEPPRRGGAEKR